ncbi:hypothetical protein [Rubrivirga sp.]|uniref:hypothetical protein n=1 Tax=Rubrivirga sp. TaxID=1885344 RepID=UPI003C75E664
MAAVPIWNAYVVVVGPLIHVVAGGMRYDHCRVVGDPDPPEVEQVYVPFCLNWSEAGPGAPSRDVFEVARSVGETEHGLVGVEEQVGSRLGRAGEARELPPDEGGDRRREGVDLDLQALSQTVGMCGAEGVDGRATRLGVEPLCGGRRGEGCGNSTEGEECEEESHGSPRKWDGTVSEPAVGIGLASLSGVWLGASAVGAWCYIER